MKTTLPYSLHSFMLPMRWDYLPKGFHPSNGKENLNFDTRTDIVKIKEKLFDTPWKRSFYKINSNPLKYNELTYFHAYATKTIFDMQQADEPDEFWVSENKTMLFYKIEPIETDFYQIDCERGLFKLSLSELNLHIYNTGVAILTFNLNNFTYSNSEDILAINEFGRRIYPQFLGETFPYTQTTKKVFLPHSITFKCEKVNGGLPIFEDFSTYDGLVSKETHGTNLTETYQYSSIISFPKYIKDLFNTNFVYNANDEIGGDIIRFNILTDDRMFFQSWYGNNEIANSLITKEEDRFNKDKLVHIKSAFMYAFMYGDKSADIYKLGIANDELRAKHVLENTYGRWANYGTFYGFTRDSFVSISNNLEDMLKNGIDIRQHFKSIYYQMAVLCLAQRASILRFSSEVSSLTDLGKSNRKSKRKNVSRRIQQLYLNYIEFVNKIYFREVSPQIQGLEIYSQFQTTMNIHNDIKDLEKEIQELHNFAMMVDQQVANEEAGNLNKIATWFLPAGAIAGIMGLNAFTDDDFIWWGPLKADKWMWVLFVVGLSACISITINWITNIINRRRFK